MPRPNQCAMKNTCGCNFSLPRLRLRHPLDALGIQALIESLQDVHAALLPYRVLAPQIPGLKTLTDLVGQDVMLLEWYRAGRWRTGVEARPVSGAGAFMAMTGIARNGKNHRYARNHRPRGNELGIRAVSGARAGGANVRSPCGVCEHGCGCFAQSWRAATVDGEGDGIDRIGTFVGDRQHSRENH